MLSAPPMNPPNHDGPPPAEEETSSSFTEKWRRRRARVSGFHLRDYWWKFLDAWEKRRGLRRTVYAAGLIGALAVATWSWIYPWWVERNAISMARQWLVAGRLDRAPAAVRQALENAPGHPESWQLAADLARRLKNQPLAVEYSRHAASLAPGTPDLALSWAADALLAEQPEVAEKALATLSPDALAHSSHAQRILGELARRRVQLTPARNYFEAALRLDGPVAIDEVPLGSILLHSRDAVERRRGLDLLTHWVTDREWGANALRTLLGDALEHDDRPAMLRWAQALRVHPRCTLGDIPNCLLALGRADPAQFAAVLALLEKESAPRATAAAQLIAWLNQTGHSAEAIAWVESLPPGLTRLPPVAVVVAEALRLSAAWEKLSAWVTSGDWGNELDFLRLVYGLQASRQLGQTARSDELWRTLQGNAQANGAVALVAADTLYSWGWQDEGLTLLWLAADQPGVTIQALGSLARHYQLQRDAEGQYRAFRRLLSLRTQDAAIANNFAFFAALTGKDSTQVEELSLRNFQQFPEDPVYRATRAFVLITQDHAAEALTLLQPVARGWGKSPALALVYGLALAGTGRLDEARPVLGSLEVASLTVAEAAMVAKALAGTGR
jgi:Tfp pilus assembly protein PilF